jgi:RHS repeat-associated protein
MTYGLEGEGRWSTLTDTTASEDIVTRTTFNAAGQPLNVQLTGTTPDQDIYTYDPNTGNMQTFEFEVGDTPANLTGTLSWNANGSLGQLGVIDGFNADGTETCYSNSSGSLGYGYDDLERLIEFDCGSGNWGQQFAYDQYDNLTKTVLSGRTGTTWNPGYSATTNHCDSPCIYDSNGDVTADGNDVYAWNAFSKVEWTATSGTPTCGTSGRCATYDAFGRMVEASVNSTWRTYWYTQAGELVMEGTTILTGRWPTSSGTVETIGTSCCEYLHNDWLGNARIVSSTSNNTVSADQAYTPYGEIYNMFGANNGQYQVFAGTIADLAPGTTTPIMWDTPNRELSYAGRWLSPDPAGSGWNQYAYAGNNPLSYRDPLGLDYCADSGGNVIADEEGGGNDFSCGNAGGNWVQAPDPTFIANSNADVSQAPTFQDDLDFLQLWASGVGPSAANNVQSRVRLEQIANHLKNCGGVYPLVAASAGNFQIGSSPGNYAQTGPSDDPNNGFNGGNSTTTIDANSFANADPTTQTGVVVHEWFHQMQINNSFLFRFRVFFNRQSVEAEANAAAKEALQKCGPG